VSPFPLTYYLPDHNAVKFVKKAFGEKDVEAVLQRLDWLTQDKAWTMAAHTLKVVYGLMKSISVVMDGEQIYLPWRSPGPGVDHSLV